jgi:DNA mismatch repair protein MutS
MFATHYHELCDLAATRSGVANHNVAAKEYRDTVVFLRKLVAGGANRSYGVAVAKLAGVPDSVLQRARALLAELEAGGVRGTIGGRDAHRQDQLDLFAAARASDAQHARVRAILERIDPHHLTPMQALELVSQLKAALTDPA